MRRQKVIIMGAGGRDFHNFNTVFRDDAAFDVLAFTATQIPFIEGRVYPGELAGHLYPEGIPIFPEDDLGALIAKHKADQIVFAYSDVSHEYIMHRASYCLSLGADFMLLGPDKTMLRSTVPVVSVCAVRTGCGKSVITRKLACLFQQRGLRASVVRHPMAYCKFVAVTRFATKEDIDRGSCTIEEREEFDPLVGRGITVYAGVDYGEVLAHAERGSDVVIWDGGNNDLSFIHPDLEIVLLDALRPGHETLFYPGEVNLRRGDLLIITKTNEAQEGALERIGSSIRNANPDAPVLRASSILSVSDPELIRGKRVLIIEDGPTITHGGMPTGAGVAAVQDIVAEVTDPRPFAEGSLRDTYFRFPHIGPVLPAMGYSETQIRELEATISRITSDVVIIATPVDLRRIIKIDKPTVRVSYDFDIDLETVVDAFLKRYGP